jgi:protein TonB
VEIEALVLPDGTVDDARVVRSLDRQFGLDDEALRAARLWRFEPPVDREGRPVRAVVTLILDFRLPLSVRTVGGQTSRPASAPPRDPGPVSPSQEDLEFRQGALGVGTPGLTPARSINIGTPRYTAAAMRAKVQGSVEIEIVVGTDGTVQRARVTRSLDPDLDQQALNAVRQSRFEAAMLDGKPVESWVRLVLDFKLY